MEGAVISEKMSCSHSMSIDPLKEGFGILWNTCRKKNHLIPFAYPVNKFLAERSFYTVDLCNSTW